MEKTSVQTKVKTKTALLFGSIALAAAIGGFVIKNNATVETKQANQNVIGSPADQGDTDADIDTGGNRTVDDNGSPLPLAKDFETKGDSNDPNTVITPSDPSNENTNETPVDDEENTNNNTNANTNSK